MKQALRDWWATKRETERQDMTRQDKTGQTTDRSLNTLLPPTKVTFVLYPLVHPFTLLLTSHFPPTCTCEHHLSLYLATLVLILWCKLFFYSIFTIFHFCCSAVCCLGDSGTVPYTGLTVHSPQAAATHPTETRSFFPGALGESPPTKGASTSLHASFSLIKTSIYSRGALHLSN